MQIKKVLPLFIVVCLLAVPLANAQFLPTNLRITVVDGIGNVVKRAKVTLYKTKKDYDDDRNAVAGPEYTDAKGIVKFKKLAPKAYYVRVVKGDRNNIGRGEKVDRLDEGKTNRVNIVID